MNTHTTFPSVSYTYKYLILKYKVEVSYSLLKVYKQMITQNIWMSINKQIRVYFIDFAKVI